jgi:hypothetical protein
MEVSGQLHASVALASREEAPITVDYETGYVPESIRMSLKFHFELNFASYWNNVSREHESCISNLDV